MAANDENSGTEKRADKRGFRISEGAMAARWCRTRGRRQLRLNWPGLPRSLRAAILFAIPRDPRTCSPTGMWIGRKFSRKASLWTGRYICESKRQDGTDESEAVVEPMLGSYYAGVVASRRGLIRPSSAFTTARRLVFRGYVRTRDDAAGQCRPKVSEVDLATVPFHLSFQRMIDLFRASNGNAIGAILAHDCRSERVRLEERFANAPKNGKFSAPWMFPSRISTRPRAFTRRIADGCASERKRCSVWGNQSRGGFGGSSPGGGFGGFSRGSAL